MQLEPDADIYFAPRGFCLAEREEVLTVSHEEYMKFVKPDPSIQVYLKGSVKETKKSYAHYETFAFTKPPLQLEVCLR